MNHKPIIGILLVSLLMTSFAMAQPGRGRRGEERSGPRGGMIQMLDLTDDQQAEISKMRSGHQKEMEVFRADQQKYKSELRLLIIADNYSQSAVDAKIAQLSSLQAKKESEKAKHLSAVRSLLDENQKSRFDQFVLSRGKPGKPGRGHRNRMHRSWQ